MAISTVYTVNAQVAINKDGSNPDSSSILDVKASDAGMLVPRMTISQRDAISSPATGLLVFVTNDNNFYYYDGSAWKQFSGGTDGDWTVSGNNMYSTVNGNIGIGTANPEEKLHVGDGTADTKIEINGINSAILFDDDNATTPKEWTLQAINGRMRLFDITEGAERMTIDNSGNIGIGTANPTNKLEMEGTILSTRIEVHDHNGATHKAFVDHNDTDALFGTTAGDINFITGTTAKKMSITSSGNVGIGTSSPQSSAILDLTSTSKGLLLPRIATAIDINNPVAGLMIYDEKTKCMRYYDGTKWSECMGKTTFVCGDAFIDSRDGKTYETVQIGSQCWMEENLNIGTMINSSNNQTNNNTIEKYCYDNNSSNCDTYGGLYQWNEAMQYVTTAGTQGICPDGWHFPTDDEFKTLEMAVGMSSSQANNSGWRDTDEGSKLAGNEPLWSNGVLDQNTNFGTSGFDALPAGYWYADNSWFYELTDGTNFWSSSETGTTAWYRYLFYNDKRVYRYDESKGNGYSVRCVKD